MANEIKIDLPFEGCTLCKMIDISTEKVYAQDAFGKSMPYIVRHYCRHEELCENAKTVIDWSMKQ